MKWLIFSLSILLLPTLSTAQEVSSYNYPYQKRLERYHAFWNKIIPAYTKVQYAGSMGFLSVGIGWDYGKKNQWETDLFLGFLPKFSTDKVKITMSLRQNYIPWDVRIGQKGFSFEPLATGLYITTIFGRQFWATNPDYYPNDYYGFSTKFRFNFYLGQRFSYTLAKKNRRLAKTFTAYYELSINDLYIESGFHNSYLKPSDYFHLSVGVKALIF